LPVEHFTPNPNRPFRRLSKPLLILLFTAAGFVVMGYHPGLEDDGIYLSAVKADLNPALYPHDAEFFRLQTQATVFDGFIAGFARLTRISVPWAELLWQFLSLYTILWAAHSIAQRLFPEQRARWSSIALLSAMFTLPVAGTALYLADQHLHPRNMATALILLGVERTLAGRRLQAFGLLLAAFAMHPIMAAFGLSLCFCLALVLTESIYARITELLARRTHTKLAAGFPLSWVFEPPTPEWRRALNTRTYYFLYRWTWYEWLGAIAPLVLLWLLWRWMSKPSGKASPTGRPVTGHDLRGCGKTRPEISFVTGHDFGRAANAAKSITALAPEGRFDSANPGRERPLLARFGLALVLYGTFQQCVAMVLLAPAALIRITPLQPMRYLHLEYILLVLIAGGLLGRHILAGGAWRWALFLAAVNGGMFLSAKILYPATEHLEMPWRKSHNSWVQAFQWIRQNTPMDAYFALDPGYLGVPGEDYHSFRALAERSQMADAVKDAAVITQVPELASRWAEQLDAQAGWKQFQAADFERLKARFGVDWVLLSYPPPAGLTCIWHNAVLSVCRVTAGATDP
jgi:hypothetical protein